MNKIYSVAVSMLAALVLSLPISAKTENVNVNVNGGTLYECAPLLVDDTTYVGIDSFRAAVGDNSEIEIAVGDDYVSANGRCVYIGSGFADESECYIPLRAAVKLYGGECEWDAESMTASVNCADSIISGDEYYDYDELYWLSRIISAESQGEPLYGKLGVGSVVMNRVKSEQFPDTIYGVIFDTEFGVQFTPVANGRIYAEPTEESVVAAKLTLDGCRVSDTALYFIYEAIATNFWTVESCNYEFTIGCHDFYS